MSRPVVVLDRDGTIIVERNYLTDPEQVELIPEVASGLRRLTEMGLGLVVVTNQSAVGREFLDEARLELVHQRLQELLQAERVHLDGIYYCPHVPEDDCSCRKPRSGLIRIAARELGFDPQSAFVIGDKACDIEMGQAVGSTTFLVRTGYGGEVAARGAARPDYTVDGLWDIPRIVEQLLVDCGRGGKRGSTRSSPSR